MSTVNRRVKMTDVARRAGVSTATVGRVIHNSGYVSEEARRRVEQAIAATGFQLNLVAQSLRRQRTQTLGHIVTTLAPNPFFAGVELGVEAVAVDAGYNVVVWNALNDSERERAGVETFIQRQIDAIVFTTPRDAANVQRALDAGMEVVQVERPTSVKSHLVLINNYIGGKAAMEHLLALGHRTIGFLTKSMPPRPDLVDTQRYQSYLESLTAAGIAPGDGWVVDGLDVYSVADGRRGTIALLTEQPEVTAVVAYSDILAAGALQAAYEVGRRVPDDLSVIGYDDTYASYLAPTMTTVAIPMVEVGRAAAQVAIEAAGAPQSGRRYTGRTINTRLIVRESTGPAPG